MPDAPEQIIINGQEYSPEDAQSLIELGSRAREIESNLNTSLDRVYPEFTKTSQRAKGLEEELAQRDARLAEYQRKDDEAKALKAKAELPEDADAIRANARKYGLVDSSFLKEQGYMTKSEMEEFYSQKEVTQRLVDNVNKQADALETEIDGSDGRVPFNKKAVLAYSASYSKYDKNLEDLRNAYEEMNSSGNAKWKDAQLEAAKTKGLTTLKGKGIKTPENPKITGDNFKDSLNEAMFGARE